MKTKDTIQIIVVMGVIMAVLVALILWGTGAFSSIESVDAQGNPIPVVTSLEVGTASAVALDAFDQAANSRSEVAPNYFVFNELGRALVSDATSNSVDAAVGDTLTAYVIGSSYYMKEEDVASKVVTKAKDGFADIEVSTIAAEASMAMAVYDRNDNELTADDDAENTADYSVSMASNDDETFKFELENQDDNSLFAASTVCVAFEYNSSAIDDVTVLGVQDVQNNEYVKVAKTTLPEEMDKVSLSIENDSDASATASGYNKCYAMEKVVYMEQNDRIKADVKIETPNTVDPIANTHAVVSVIFLDSSFEDNKDGEVEFGFFKGDDDEQVTAVGLAETIASPQGKQIGASVELQ